MSWVSTDLFENFLKEEEKEKEKQPQQTGPRRMDVVYPTFERGKDENTAIKYQGRLLPNINTKNPQHAFKIKYYYHFFKNTEGKWTFILCPKTWGEECYCTFCSVSSKLYNSGSSNDKKLAPKYLRKEKYVVNYFCVDDPRDVQRISDGKERLAGKVWVLEFPGKLNSKIVEEQKPGPESAGMKIYDPEDGYNIIVLVKSTKANKDDKGNIKQFHDYNDSKFARNASAIADSREEIEKIMGTRHDLISYIKSMERSIPDMVSILKEEMVWEWVKEEFKKKNLIELEEETPVDTPDEDMPVDTDEVPWEETEDKNTTETKKEKSTDRGDIDLQTLLAEAGVDID